MSGNLDSQEVPSSPLLPRKVPPIGGHGVCSTNICAGTGLGVEGMGQTRFLASGSSCLEQQEKDSRKVNAFNFVFSLSAMVR